MYNTDNYDEKQLQDRGKAYKYGFIAGILTPVILFFIQDVMNLKIETYGRLLISLWVPLTVCFISLIVKDCYDRVNSNTGKIFMSIFGLGGLFLLALSIPDYVRRDELLINHNTITASAGQLLSYICMILGCIVYWLKQIYNNIKFSKD